MGARRGDVDDLGRQPGLAFEVAEPAPPRQPMSRGRKLSIAAFEALILVIAAVRRRATGPRWLRPGCDLPFPSTPIETGAGPDVPDASAADDGTPDVTPDATPDGTPDGTLDGTSVDAGDSTIIGASAELDAVIRSSRPPVLSLIDIAPELADRAPTEVVALHDDRGLVEVSMPSGRVARNRSRLRHGLGAACRNRFRSLVWPMPGGSYELLSVGGATTFVNTGPSEFVLSTPGLDRFYVWRNTGTAAALTTQVDDGSMHWATAEPTNRCPYRPHRTGHR